MLRHFIKLILIVCLAVLHTGCDIQKQWTWQQWLEEVSLQGGFTTAKVNALEDLDEFELIDLAAYAMDESLTYSMVEYTAEALVNHVLGLNELLSIKKDQVLTDKQAQNALAWLVDQLNDFGSETKTEIVYQSKPIAVTVIERNGNWIKVTEEVAIDDLVELDSHVFQVSEVENGWISLSEADYEAIKEMNLEGRVSFDPLDSQIVVQEEILELNQMPGAGLPAARLSKSFEIQGFTVRISASSDSIHVYASKKMPSVFPVFVQFDINEINCSFKWKTKEDQVEASALKVSYETSLTSGLRTTDYEDRVLDFSKTDSSNLIQSLKNAFVRKSDVLEESIELAQIQLPFPQIPVCMLKMKIMLHLYAGGKAEIAFESDHETGFELINGHLRRISSIEKQSHTSLRASAKATTKLQFGLSVAAKDCMDIAVETGIQAVAETKAMMEDGKHQSIDVPYELAEEASAQNDQLIVCADLDAYWILNLLLNSKNTVLGNMGISKQIELINSSNGSLFGKTIHLENFQRVEHCTRSFMKESDISIELNSDRIELKHYLLILEEGESELIEISALPEKLHQNELIYCSMDDKIASVNSKGKVKALKSGETIVIVSSKDGEYESQCSVFVR